MNSVMTRGRNVLLEQQLRLQRLWQMITTFWARLDWLLQPTLAFGLSRLLIFAAGYLGDTFLPTAEGHWVADPNSPFLSMWAKWDSQWYVQIARDGYWFQPLGQSNVAFFPLYPLSMRLVSRFVHENYVLAGFIVSNLAFFLALIYLYRLAELELGNRTAARCAIFYLALFPTAFFFSSVYTESLYVMLSIATMYYARRHQWLGAAVAGLLAAATRNLGVLLWALVMWEWMRYHGWQITRFYRLSAWRNLLNAFRHHWHEWLLIAAIPLGMLLYIAFLKTTFDRPFAFIEVQAAWGRQNIGPVAVLLRELRALATSEFNQGGLSRLLNVGAVLAVLATVPFIWHKLGEGYAIYVLILILVPISSAAQSVIRYVLPLFPVFIMLGWWGRRESVDRVVMATFAILLGVLTTIFVNWGFVA